MKILILLILVVSFLFSCGKEDKPSQKVIIKPQYRTTSPTEENSVITKEFPANVSFNPDGVVSLSPQIAGQVESISVKVGDQVKRGQILAKLKTADTTDIVSSYYETKTQYIQAKRIYELNKKLYEVGAISKNDLIASETNLNQLEYALKGLQEKQKTLGVRDFSYIYLKSPIDGVVYEISSTIGSRVSPDSPVLKIANKSKFIVVANVYEKDIKFVSVGDSVKVIVDNAWIEGKVIYISDVLDPDTRTVKVYIKPENTDNFRANMFVSVSLTKHLKDYLSVDKRAIMFKDNRFYVYLLNQDGSITKREISIIGDSTNHNYSIVSGLKKEDRLILDPINLGVK